MYIETSLSTFLRWQKPRLYAWKHANGGLFITLVLPCLSSSLWIRLGKGR